MAAVAFVLHHRHPEARRLAADLCDWLVERGHAPRLPAADAGLIGRDELGCTDAELVRDLDLAVSLGGDGTMLRTVDLVSDALAPVLGVNLGQLGYLTEVEPAALPGALDRFLGGDYAIEERMRLDVEVEAPSHADTPRGEHLAAAARVPALNEAVVGKTPSGQIVRLDVSIDGEHVTTYSADGVIVATPTGSTAYAWSAGGPIVAPTLAALQLTPVAPHMVFGRPLVLEPRTRVRLAVVDGRPASLSVDGRNLGQLVEGDAITCTAAEHPARLVTFGPRSFVAILKAKFDLGKTPGTP